MGVKELNAELGQVRQLRSKLESEISEVEESLAEGILTEIIENNLFSLVKWEFMKDTSYFDAVISFRSTDVTALEQVLDVHVDFGSYDPPYVKKEIEKDAFLEYSYNHLELHFLSLDALDKFGVIKFADIVEWLKSAMEEAKQEVERVTTAVTYLGRLIDLYGEKVIDG